jgi:hypothetical protein
MDGNVGIGTFFSFFSEIYFIFLKKCLFKTKLVTCCTIRSQQEQNLRARMDERTQERQETARLHQALQVHGFNPARSFSFDSLFVQCFTCWSLCHCWCFTVSPCHRCSLVSPQATNATLASMKEALAAADATVAALEKEQVHTPRRVLRPGFLAK